jgi:hypothetical protein
VRARTANEVRQSGAAIVRGRAAAGGEQGTAALAIELTMVESRGKWWLSELFFGAPTTSDSCKEGSRPGVGRHPFCPFRGALAARK